MRIVVTGRDGQVARSLCERGALAGHDVVPLARPDLDLSGPADAIITGIEAARPEVIVSAAAYTAVDKAEQEPDLAFAVNERGAAAVATAGRRLGVPVIHLSTDYVFDGRKATAYSEEDETGPTGVYGASKLAGERAVLAEHANAAVLRTAWVYSPFGANFVKTMLRLAADRDSVRVVADQRGNPTSALDIADAVLAVAANLSRSDDPEARGLFHMTASGDASWAEFASAIFAASRDAGGPSAAVHPITTADYPTPARRPANSRLDCSKLRRAHGVSLRNWQKPLVETVSRLTQSSN